MHVTLQLELNRRVNTSLRTENSTYKKLVRVSNPPIHTAQNIKGQPFFLLSFFRVWGCGYHLLS